MSAPLLNGCTRLEDGQIVPARLVSKDGACLVDSTHNDTTGKILRLETCRNWFHHIIELSWRNILFIFGAGFLFSWGFFGLVYYGIVKATKTEHTQHSKQCIGNVHNLISAILFSIESQHTIGYGIRYMTDMCLSAIFVLCCQLILGVLLQTVLAGIVVAKVLRPKKRRQDLRFSQRAVIAPMSDTDSTPVLMIRIADTQHKLYLAESHVRLYMAIKNKSGVMNGGIVPLISTPNANGDAGAVPEKPRAPSNRPPLIGLRDMNVGYDNGYDRVLLLWPIVIRHVIDENSPLYGWRGNPDCPFELIMTVEGIVEATGMTFQARTSFLPDEISWGQRFVDLVRINPKTKRYEVDYSSFEKTESVPLAITPPEYSYENLSFNLSASGFT